MYATGNGVYSDVNLWTYTDLEICIDVYIGSYEPTNFITDISCRAIVARSGIF